MIDEPFKASLCFSDGRQFGGCGMPEIMNLLQVCFIQLKRSFVLSSEPYDSESGQWHPIQPKLCCRIR